MTLRVFEVSTNDRVLKMLSELRYTSPITLEEAREFIEKNFPEDIDCVQRASLLIKNEGNYAF